MDKKNRSLQGLFQNAEQSYFDKLDKLSRPLRHCAHDMVVFIDQLAEQSAELQNLKQTYHQLEFLPIKDLGDGLEKLHKNLDSLVFESIDAQNQPDFLAFFTIQNHFNTEMNTLVRQAVQISK